MKQIADSITKAYINLDAFNHNIKIIRNKFPKSIIILPVKANAYGHGDIIISQQAQKIGIEYLAVARVKEGIKLRQNNITLPIINFGIALDENIDIALENNIELSISSIEYIFTDSTESYSTILLILLCLSLRYTKCSSIALKCFPSVLL